MDSLADKSPVEKYNSDKKDEAHFLFEIVLDSDKPNETVRIYDVSPKYCFAILSEKRSA